MLDQLDLSYLIPKLQTTLAWGETVCWQQIGRYKKFLRLLQKYPNLPLAPTAEIDEVWHQHILFTRQYAQDCQSLFGYFLHHFPEEYSEDNEQQQRIKANSLEKLLTTALLYEMEFSEPYLPTPLLSY